jgi:hypothetical protein
MSEFTCRYGHYMRFQDHFCPACAAEGRPDEGLFYMDGMTARQHTAMEREAERAQYEDAEEDDE